MREWAILNETLQLKDTVLSNIIAIYICKLTDYKTMSTFQPKRIINIFIHSKSGL